MKLKKILFTSFLIGIIQFFLIDSIVVALENGTTGSHAEVASCDSGGWCFSGAVGFRITIVNKSGERIAFDGKKFIKSGDALAKAKAKYISKSVDYWINDNDLHGTGSDTCYSYNQKLTKKEFTTNVDNKDKNIVKCKNDSAYGEYYNIHDDLGFPKVPDNDHGNCKKGDYNTKWVCDSNIDSSRKPQNINILIDWLTCVSADDTSNLNSFDGGKLNCKGYTKSDKVLNNIFRNSFSSFGKKLNVKDFDLNNMYIQFEQLLQVTNYGGNYLLNDSVIYMGTVAEASAMYKRHNYKGSSAANYSGSDRWCTIRTNSWSSSKYFKKTKIYNMTDCGSYMIDGGYWSGWYGKNSTGIGLNKASGINLQPMTDIKKFASSSSFDINYFYKKNTNNVFAFWLKNLKSDTCDSELGEIIGKRIDGKITKKQYNKAIDDLFKKYPGEDDLPELKDDRYQLLKMDASNAKCSISCSTVFDRYSDVSDFITNVLENKNVLTAYNKYIDKINSSNGKLAFGASVYRKYKKDFKNTAKNIRDNLSGNDICKPVECDDALSYIDSSDDKQVAKLDALYNPGETVNYPFLKKDFYEVTGKPNCDPLPENCEPVKEVNCNGKVVIGSGDENQEECVTSGILYYKSGGIDLTTSLHSNYTAQANSIRNNYLSKIFKNKINTDDIDPLNVYCSEKVTFDMPQSFSEKIKAGRVFQWGKNIDIKNNNGSNTDSKTFAYMTLEQYCYIVGPYNSLFGGKVIFDRNSIKTKIQFDYKDVTSVYKIGYGQSNTGMINDPIIISESVKNTDFDNFQTKVVYRFDYGNNLAWYSKKGSDDDMKSKNNISSSNLNQYVFIGYGLPTSFSTPDGTYSTNLKVKISNIGTNGAFDKINNMQPLEYNCPFKVHNELFGNECCNPATGQPFANAPSYCTCNGTGGGPKGIDVVFRTIKLTKANPTRTEKSKELAKAFPGRTGGNTARKIGRNWQEVVDNNTVYSILDDSVYTKSPRYSIKLNSTNISKIRDYNKSARNARVSGKNVDPYTYLGTATGSESNGFIGYKCDSSKGAYGYCVSNFLEKLRSSLGLKGTCMTRSTDINTRLSKGVCGQ